MSDLVKIIECPRDAWQGLPTQIPAKAKADYLQKLIAAGFHAHRCSELRFASSGAANGGLGEGA